MSKIILLDTNLLTLLIIGFTKVDLIGRHKNTRDDFSVHDFELLKKTISLSSEIIVAPHVLAEASSLLRQIGDPDRSKIMNVFCNFIERTKEIYIKSSSATARDEFVRLGLTDNILIEAGSKDIVLLSTDAPLCIAAELNGHGAINFDHVRAAAGIT